jgi:phosphohistidine phosphatase
LYFLNGYSTYSILEAGRNKPFNKMKTLFLVRHAKSVTHFTGGSDFARGLNERGMKDAKEMAKRLIRKDILIDQFVSSPAVRAKTTAEIFVDQYNRKPEEIDLIPELYHASQDIFEEIIAALDNRFDRVAVFSHNPGISDFATYLSKSAITHMPTCSVLGIASDIKSWQDFFSAEKTFLFFDSPKAVPQ